MIVDQDREHAPFIYFCMYNLLKVIAKYLDIKEDES